MIYIPSKLLEEILAHAKSEAPNEVCGWLAGSPRSRRNESLKGHRGMQFSGGAGKMPAKKSCLPRNEPESMRRDAFVEKIYPVPNASERPITRFVMEPESQISAMREIRESGLEIVGTYHSHPKSPAHPSGRDLGLALYPDIPHLIVSLSDGEARWWWISDSGIEEA